MESLIEHPALVTHASVAAPQRAALGIGDALVRLSVGIEDQEEPRHKKTPIWHKKPSSCAAPLRC